MNSKESRRVIICRDCKVLKMPILVSDGIIRDRPLWRCPSCGDQIGFRVSIETWQVYYRFFKVMYTAQPRSSTIEYDSASHVALEDGKYENAKL